MGEGTPGRTEAPAPELAREFRRRNAVVLYVSSVLGSGVLVLPGLAARLAGPASLLAWVLMALASIPFGLTFASLSARRPEAGGVYGFAKEALGPTGATVTGWLFTFWAWTGAPVVSLIAASYLGYAFPLDRPETYIAGFAVVLGAFAVNLRGTRVSNRVQLALLGGILGLLLLTIALSLPRVHVGEFTPFFPEGVASVGTAAALIFWSFLGYENTSNVAEEFTDAARDFRPSVGISLAIVGVLYFAIAFVTIGTGASSSGGGVAPFATLLSAVFGPWAAAATAVFAVVIIFAVVNAYTTGMSRVLFATARDDGAPHLLAHLHPGSQVPDRALVALFGGASLVLAAYYVAGIDLTTALLVTSGMAMTVYVVGSISALRIFRKEGRTLEVGMAGATLVISVAVMPFVGWPLLVSAVPVACGLLYVAFARRRS